MPMNAKLVMIVCHSKKFLFIKPRKVAGTTIELELSRLLTSGDCATSIEPNEEVLRPTAPGVKVGSIQKYKSFGFFGRLRDHSTLAKAYSILGEKVKTYLVVSACRNPWDRAVSQFFWSYRKKRIQDFSFDTQKIEFNRFTKTFGPQTWLDKVYGRKRQRALNSSHLYTIDKRICVDYIIRFEKLENDIDTLVQALNFDNQFRCSLPQTKSIFRPKTSRRWQDFYDSDTTDLVANCCADEIRMFNYNFEGTTLPKGQFVKDFVC